MTHSGIASALRAYLRGVARRGETVIYRDAARDLQLPPPHTIHRLALLLEELIEEDANNGVPLIASLVVSKQRNGLPAPGFFAKAREMGQYDGPESGPPAQAFHQTELARALEYWGRTAEDS